MHQPAAREQERKRNWLSGGELEAVKAKET